MSGKRAKATRKLARSYVLENGYSMEGKLERDSGGSLRYGYRTMHRVYKNLKRSGRHPRRGYDICR